MTLSRSWLHYFKGYIKQKQNPPQQFRKRFRPVSSRQEVNCCYCLDSVRMEARGRAGIQLIKVCAAQNQNHRGRRKSTQHTVLKTKQAQDQPMAVRKKQHIQQLRRCANGETRTNQTKKTAVMPTTW